MDLLAGTLIGARYRLERLLGEGGMGSVWAAEDIATHQRTALKLMKAPAGDPDARRRFVREARAAAAVHHPNVVSIFDVLELDDGAPVIVMELLEGESLRAMLVREHKLPLVRLTRIIVQVVSAIGAAHARGIVHRDLKPENIFIARGFAGQAVVKVLDFGIAKLTALDSAAVHASGVTTGAVVGTPTHMAPEQVFGETDLDHRADIWALGIILYQCLSGVLPTDGDNVGQVLKNVLAKPFEPLDQLVPGLPEEIARLVARMLARERSARPSDLREVADLLEQFASKAGMPFDLPAEQLRVVAEPIAPPVTSRNTIPVDSADALAVTLRAPPPRPRLPRRRAIATGAAAIALLGSGLAAWRWSRPTAPAQRPTVAPSPLGSPSAKIACPVLRASGVEAPAGWLGAAAAAIVCERARLLLGGRPDRTLVPAELLELPRTVVDGAPADPYGQSDARERSVRAAQRLAAAYVDGAVVKQRSGFSVTLELHTADASPLGRAEGSGRGLYEAVRNAMTPLVGPDRVPRADQLDPEIAAWSRTPDVDAALDVLDVSFAMANNAGELADECARFEQRRSRVGELGPAMRWLCAYTAGLPPPHVELGAPDPSAAGFATWIRIRHLVQPVEAPADAARLHDLHRSASGTWGKSLLAATESCLVQASDPRRALTMAIAAVTDEPKNPDGHPCDPWGQLMTMMEGSDNATRAMQAWQPWNDIGWFMQGLAAGNPEAALRPLRRAYELSPFNAQVAGAFADQLFAAGRREEARGVAIAVGAGSYPVHQVESEILLLRFDASAAHFRAALDAARGAFDVSAGDAGWVRAQRFDAAWRALEVAGILGRASQLADELVHRFLDPDPPLLDGNAVPVPARIAAICALASTAVSGPCFVRAHALRAQLSGGITPQTDDFLRGAERYAKHDYAAAARAWRPLLRDAGALAAVLPDAMADVFDRSGDRELAAQVDDAVMRRADEFNGATLGHVRAAWRASRRGDRATARALARKVIAAWQVADDLPPAVADMRRLLAQLAER